MTLLKEKVTNKELDVSQLTATPFYNLAIFEDIVLHTLQKILTKAILPYDTIRQAIVLFQVKVVFSLLLGCLLTFLYVYRCFFFSLVFTFPTMNGMDIIVDLVNSTSFALSIRWIG